MRVLKQFQDQLLVKVWHCHFDAGCAISKDMATTATEGIIGVLKEHFSYEEDDVLMEVEGLMPVQEALL